MDLTPGIGLGPIRLGETRREHVARLGNPTNTFRRTSIAPDTHRYAELGLFLNYDEADALVFVETFDMPVHLGGVLLTDRPVDEVRLDLAGLGFAGVRDDVGYKFPGFGLYAPLDDVESVSLGNE